jgi:hypothetical protein
LRILNDLFFVIETSPPTRNRPVMGAAG